MGKFIEKKKAQALAYMRKQLEDYTNNKILPASYSVLQKHCKEEIPSYETFQMEVLNEMGGLN